MKRTGRPRSGPTRLRRDRRGTVALMFAAMAPVLLGFAAIVVDTGFWLAGQAQLQVKADAAAMGAAYMLRQASFVSLGLLDQTLALQAAAQVEAAGITSRFNLSIGTPAVTFSSSSVTVTLSSQTGSYFMGVFDIQPPRVTATATASYPPNTPCVLQLGIGLASMRLDNTATVSASLCPITINGALFVSSGTLRATAINVLGGVSVSGGGNVINPAVTVTASVAADPYAGQVAPARGSCASHPDYTAYGTYVANPGTWCGNTTIGGNGSTITFNPGVYYVAGDLTFNNASITSATGVTFVVTGNLGWTNYSNTASQITAPTSGATAGIAFWQPCGLLQTSSFQGGGTLLVAGAVYSPCASADLGNNAQVAAPLNQSMSFISRSLYVHGSASLRASLIGGSASGGSAPVLVQ